MPSTAPAIKQVRTSPPRILLHAVNAKGASGIYRLAAPADALRKNGYATTIVNYHVPTTDMLNLLNPDSVVIQHFFTDAGIEAAKTYKKHKGLFLAFEIDDLFWDMDNSNPNKADTPPDVLARMRKVSSFADVAVVSTPRLAEHVKKNLGFSYDRIKIVRNRLPQAFFTLALANKPKGAPVTKPRVGWAGGISHPGDLAILKEVVERTADRIQWVFMVAQPEGLPTGLVEFHPPAQFAHYPAKLAALNLDLAVAPLADTEFNACKSDLRILEYAACGYPVIASDSVAFSECSDAVIKTANTPDAWIGSILAALNDRVDLDDRAQRLHDWAKENRTLESTDNLKRWAWAWTSESKAIFEPRSSVDETAPVIVGEPIDSLDTPPFRTIAEAHQYYPNSPIICVRPGCVPTDEQLAELISAGPNSLSACTLSNDGDYPGPGRFTPLMGKVMRDMSEAALNIGEMAPISIPYATGPLTYLSAKALAVAGLPDEARYDNDPEMAIIDWCARLRDMNLGGHVALPNLFIPVHAPGRLSSDQEFTKKAIQEIATWHPSFQSCEQETQASNPLFAEARRAIDMGYVRISYEAPICTEYSEWTALHDAWTPAAKEWAESIDDGLAGDPRPVISIILPVYNTSPEHLIAAIDSVKAQSYQHWQLVVVNDASTNEETLAALHSLDDSDPRIQVRHRDKNGHISEASNTGLEQCTGDWVYFLDHDDTLAPYTLTAFAIAITNNPKAKLVYGDSDMISPDGQLHSPDFKPDFDYDLLLGQNYIRGCYKTSVVKEIHGFRTAYNGSQDYDLLLRYIERACWREDKAGPDLTTIEHIPLVVYHWRQAPGSVSVDINNKPYAIDAAHKAVLEHIRRTERTAFIGQHPYAPLHHLVRFLPSDPVPKASIIILTQLDRKRLDTCISSILKNTNYSNYEVVVRQVGDDPGISETMRHWVKRDPRVKHAKGGGHGGTFNFALLNNTAVDKHVADDTEVLVFLNDDTQIIETAWLGDMVGMAMRPDVGAVGVKLIYPNGQIQHNGIGIDRDAVAGEYALHLHRGAMRTDPGSLGRGALTHQVSAVTAACMAVRREVFRAVKGFNAIKFPLDYNDVDLCLRLLKAGYVNAVLSHIAVVHHEGGTKRLNPYQVNRTAMLASEYAVRCEHEDFVDPYGNPNKEHHFSGNVIKTFPPRPWKENRLPRSLVIGADKTDAHSLFIGGELPIRAEGDGPYLRLTEPTAEHGGTVDLRDKFALARLLSDLDINRIVLRRVRMGSPDALLGALTDVGGAGMQIDYWPASFEAVCPRLDCTNSDGACGHKWKMSTVDACQECVDKDGSLYGSVSIAAYRLTWDRFSRVLNSSKDDSVVTPITE